MQITAWAARKSTELKVGTEFRYWNCYPLTLNRCELARPDRIVHPDLAHRAFLCTKVPLGRLHVRF